MSVIEIAYKDVLAAARKVAAQPGEGRNDGWWRSWEVPALVAQVLGVADARNNSTSHRSGPRFDAQATRAFNALAVEGVLVKVGRGERSPHGRRLGNEAEFYTPSAYKNAVAEMETAQAQRARTRQAWESVWDRLTALGLSPRAADGRGHKVRLDLEDWEKILDEVEIGREQASRNFL
jgi:uncharacterized protein DUF3693